MPELLNYAQSLVSGNQIAGNITIIAYQRGGDSDQLKALFNGDLPF